MSAKSKFSVATATMFMVPVGILSAAAIIIRLPLHFVVSILDGVISASVNLLRGWSK